MSTDNLQSAQVGTDENLALIEKGHSWPVSLFPLRYEIVLGVCWRARRRLRPPARSSPPSITTGGIDDVWRTSAR